MEILRFSIERAGNLFPFKIPSSLPPTFRSRFTLAQKLGKTPSVKTRLRHFSQTHFRTPLVLPPNCIPEKVPAIFSLRSKSFICCRASKPQTQTHHWVVLRHRNAAGELCHQNGIHRPQEFQIKIVGGKATKTDSRFYQELLGETYYRHYRPNLLFWGHSGAPHNERSIQDAVRKAMKDSGLERLVFPRIRFGILCHAFARSRQ
jgi:hypothetical protein